MGCESKFDVVFKFVDMYIGILYKVIDFDSREIVVRMLRCMQKVVMEQVKVEII